MKRILLLLFLVAPAPAFALSLDYYTYDGFQETVDAFTRLALIFSDTAFMGFTVTFAIVGVLAGALMFGAKAHMGQATNPIGWLIPILFGAVVFKGLVIPTGTLYVYDPVLNANQAVGGVPDIVILLAGGLNEVERDIVQVVDTASANPYASTGGMATFNLLMSSMGSEPDDVNLGRSIAQYYTDCGTFAIALNSNGVTLQELKRSSTDLYNTFAKFTNGTVQTVYYADGNDQGAPMSCTAAWGNLSTALNTASTFSTMESEICKRASFDPTVSAELTQCDSDITTASQVFGVTPGSSLPFLRSAYLAQSIVTALQSGPYSLGESEIMNRQVMTESLGSAEAMNEWIPKLRAFMTACVIGLVPLLALFMMTPLAWKSLAVVIGLFTWLFFWGICDAVASTMANDAAINAFAQISHYNLGFDAIVNTPEGAVKALGIFGKARSMGLGLATLLSGSLMAFGGVALAQLSQNWQRDVEQKGEQSGKTAILPEQRGAFIQQIVSGMATEGTVARYGLMDTAMGQARGAMENASWARTLRVNPSLSGGAGSAGIADTTGIINAGSSAGMALGTTAAAVEGIRRAGNHGNQFDGPPSPLAIASVAAGRTEFETAKQYGTTSGEQLVAGRDGASGFKLGETGGGLGAGRTLNMRDLYHYVNGNDDYSSNGWYRVGRQLEGSALGLAKAGTPEHYVEQAQLLAEKAYGFSDHLRDHPGEARFFGQTEAAQQLVNSDAFDAIAKHYGTKAQIQGAKFSQAQSVESGSAAAAAPGGLYGTAHDISRQAVAGQEAGAIVQQHLVGALGDNPRSMSDLIGWQVNQGGAGRSIVLTKDNMDQAFVWLHENGIQFKSDIESAVRRQGGGQLVADLDQQGRPVSGRLSAGTQGDFFDIGRTTTGTSNDYYHTDSRHYNKGPDGDIGILNAQDLGGELAGTYKGITYDKDDRRLFAVASTVGDAMRRMGVDLTADQAYEVFKSGKVGLSGGASAGVGTPGGSPLSAGATVGISGSVDKTWQSAQRTGIHANGNTLAAAAAFDAVRETAISDVWRERGEGFMKDPARAEEAARLVGERQAQLAIDRVVELTNLGRGETKEILEKNNAVEAQQAADDNRRTPPEVRQEREVQKLRAEPKI